MPGHVKSSLMGVSVNVPISDGRLALGTWQGIYLNEHRYARERRSPFSGEAAVGSAQAFCVKSCPFQPARSPKSDGAPSLLCSAPPFPAGTREGGEAATPGASSSLCRARRKQGRGRSVRASPLSRTRGAPQGPRLLAPRPRGAVGGETRDRQCEEARRAWLLHRVGGSLGPGPQNLRSRNIAHTLC
jgi:hypothetical protein